MTAPMGEREELLHEACFLLDRLEELSDAEDMEYVTEFEGHVRPSMSRLRRLTNAAVESRGHAQSAPVSVESVARTICLSYGRDPDEMTAWTEMCDANNHPVPTWRVYEEQADAVLKAHSAALRAPEAADAGAVAWRWHPKGMPGHGWTYTESKNRADWCLLYEHPCEPLYASPTVAPPDDAWVNDPRGKAFEMGRDAAVEVLQKHFDDHQSPEAEAIAAALSYAYAEVRCLVAPNFPMPAARPAAKADTARRLHSYILHNYASAAASSGRQKSFESNLIEMFAALTAPVAGADAGMRERAAPHLNNEIYDHSVPAHAATEGPRLNVECAWCGSMEPCAASECGYHKQGTRPLSSTDGDTAISEVAK